MEQQRGEAPERASIAVHVRVRTTANAILDNSETRPIVIVLGDHSAMSEMIWEDPDKANIGECMAIPGEYCLPQEGKRPLYPRLYPLNCFRVLPKRYIGKCCEMLAGKCFFGAVLFNRFAKSPLVRVPVAPSLKSLLVVFAILCMLLLILIWPLVADSYNLPWTAGKLSIDGFRTITMLVSGTANTPLTVVYFVLCLTGLAILIRRNTLLGVTFATIICAYLLVLFVTRPNGVHDAVVMLRYMIVVVPITMTLAALAFDSLYVLTQRLTSSAGVSKAVIAIFGVCLIASLFVTGPLPETYVSPNNFTNHSAFQGSYEHHTWDRSDARHIFNDFPAKQDEIPGFYHWLNEQNDIQTIIEYPFDFANSNNLLYYYQHFHKKRVIVGYSRERKYMLRGIGLTMPPEDEARLGEDVNLCMGWLDSVLCRTGDAGTQRFRNMLDIADRSAIVRSQADVIVLHRGVTVLCELPEGHDFATLYYPSVPEVEVGFRQAFGTPIYEDDSIICFRIR